MTADPSRKRILVVEDDEDSAELLGETLERKGYQVAIAHSGREALEKAAGFEPHVAFVDLGLPDMDGAELGPRLQALPTPPLRVIALTGYGGAEAQARLLQAGFDQCLLKPAHPDAVALAVEGGARRRP